MNGHFRIGKTLLHSGLAAGVILGLLGTTPAYAFGSSQGKPGATKGKKTTSTDRTTGNLVVTIYDGTRHPIEGGTSVLLKIFDGNQKELVSNFYKGPTVEFAGLPVYDNSVDALRVVAWTKGYNTEGVVAVQIFGGRTVSAEIMLLPHHGQLVFESWPSVQQNYPWLASLLAHGAASDKEAQGRYEKLMADDPGSLAALLNITTAGSQIDLDGGTFLSYFKELIWEEQRPEWRLDKMVGFKPRDDSEHTMRHDRFWAWADRRLVDQVRAGVTEGTFFPELLFRLFHPGATSSFKEKRMQEGHIHVSFYETDSRIIDGVDCVLLEIHIDLYQDLLAHGLLEVLPDTVEGKVTQPEDAYPLRWIAGLNSGRRDFDPPFVIVPFTGEQWHRHAAKINQLTLPLAPAPPLARYSVQGPRHCRNASIK